MSLLRTVGLIFVGLINQKCTAFIGSGVVVHIPSLFNELDTLERKGEALLGAEAFMD
jgi:adenylosuccinate synthase